MTSHIIIHNDHSVWSTATIVYATLSAILFTILFWATTYPAEKEVVEDNRVILALVLGYLLFGLFIVMTCSHNNTHVHSWIIISGLLTPALIVLFWVVYRYHHALD